MESKNIEPTKGSFKLKWAEFALDAGIKIWLLVLLTLLLLFVMAVVAFIVWYDKDPTGAIIGAIATGVVMALCKWVHSELKSPPGGAKE